MAGASRRRQRAINIWPGFVDALATLLMVIIFVLLVFVLAQVFLSEVLSGRETALAQLRGQLAELADVLALERKENDQRDLALAQLKDQLQTTLSRAEQAETALAANTDETTRVLADLAALQALKQKLEQEAASQLQRTQTAETVLAEEQKLSETARAQVALLNQQINALRAQLAQLAAALESSEKKTTEQQLQISALGQCLNAALAGKVQELARYRSEFFGRMREILGENPDIRIVGDRFVFPSEVLFDRGSAEVGTAGREQLIRAAQALKDVTARIPPEIDWILQVEGHTDRVPISTPQFPSNWELSTARATSVIRLLTEHGIAQNRLSAAGYGEFHPLDTGASEAAMQRNRRIELKLTQR